MKISNKLSKAINLLLFTASLCFVLWFLGSLYIKNYKEIIEGTYVYDRFETPLMMSLLLIVFLVLLYLGVKLFNKKHKNDI